MHKSAINWTKPKGGPYPHRPIRFWSLKDPFIFLDSSPYVKEREGKRKEKKGKKEGKRGKKRRGSRASLVAIDPRTNFRPSRGN